LLRPELLRDLLSVRGIGTRDRLLILLAVDAEQAKSVSTLKTLAMGAGWRGITKVNVSAFLGRSNGLAVRTVSGWELTSDGRTHVAPLISGGSGTVVATVAPALRSHLPAIASPDARSFAEEAVKCFEARFYRAAVVLSWVGAIAVLYDHVITHHLAAFNTEALRRDAKWKDARTSDDLARMKEHDFLDMLAAISVIGKNVKEELQKGLKLRNACGHPNSLKVGEHTAAAHIELLILNVFSKF
jgi:hypothetical protein